MFILIKSKIVVLEKDQSFTCEASSLIECKKNLYKEKLDIWYLIWISITVSDRIIIKGYTSFNSKKTCYKY